MTIHWNSNSWPVSIQPQGPRDVEKSKKKTPVLTPKSLDPDSPLVFFQELMVMFYMEFFGVHLLFYFGGEYPIIWYQK